MRKRCSETRFEGKQSEDCHGFHASALLVLQISLKRSAMHRFLQTYSKRYDFFDRFRSFSSTAIDRGIGIDRFGVEKNAVRFLYRNVRRASKKLFGPRKPQCVDFIRHTYSKRYDFFDRFRPFSSTAIDRGIGIDRFGSKKRRSISVQKCTARQQKNVRAPKTAMRRFYSANI